MGQKYHVEINNELYSIEALSLTQAQQILQSLYNTHQLPPPLVKGEVIMPNDIAIRENVNPKQTAQNYQSEQFEQSQSSTHERLRVATTKYTMSRFAKKSSLPIPKEKKDYKAFRTGPTDPDGYTCS